MDIPGFKSEEQKGRVRAVRYLPNGDQMKRADMHTIHDVGIPSLVLMERAALKIVEALEDAGVPLDHTLAVCGSGNNGGDGFAAARIIAEKGHRASVLFVGKESSLSEECRVQKQIAENLGIPVFTTFPEEEYTVIIDAVFGVGLSREVTGHYAEVIRWMNAQNAFKAAADIPSGICSATGRVLGTAFGADLTVAIACEKLGCALYPGKRYAGKTVVVPIGIDPELFADDPSVCFTWEKEELGSLLPKRPADSHKGTYGKVLMITGSSGMAGAAYLSAKAAYTAGAGLVQVYTSEDNRQILQQLLPEAIISCYEGYEENRLDDLLEWADVVCIGCGLGQSETSERILVHTLEQIAKPCIIDADGLNLLSRHMELLECTERCPVILTPHMKEMSRLTGKSVAEISKDRMSVLDEFMGRWKAVCVLKDSRTIAARQGRRRFVNLAGNSAMAKAGSGDVLAGVITGLTAQRMDAFQSAALGVWIHACGGDEAKAEKGSFGVLPRDLIDGIQKCMKRAEESMER